VPRVVVSRRQSSGARAPGEFGGGAGLQLSGTLLRPRRAQKLSRPPEVTPVTQRVLPGHRHGLRAEPLSCCLAHEQHAGQRRQVSEQLAKLHHGRWST